METLPGRNELVLNKAAMLDAVHCYLGKMFKDGAVPTVTDIRYSKDNMIDTYIVTMDEKEEIDESPAS